MAEESIVGVDEKPAPAPLKDGAIVARRLTEEDIKREGVEVRYLVSAFVDSRIDENLSVDYMGENGNHKITKRMITELTPIAEKDIIKADPKALFVGWAGLKRKTLGRHMVVRTPITSGDNPNPHHCDILRDNHRNKAAALSLAYELVALAEKDNMFYAAAVSKSVSVGSAIEIVASHNSNSQIDLIEKKMPTPLNGVVGYFNEALSTFVDQKFLFKIIFAFTVGAIFWWVILK